MCLFGSFTTLIPHKNGFFTRVTISSNRVTISSNLVHCVQTIHIFTFFEDTENKEVVEVKNDKIYVESNHDIDFIFESIQYKMKDVEYSKIETVFRRWLADLGIPFMCVYPVPCDITSRRTSAFAA